MEEKIVDSQYQTKGYLCYLGILVLIPLLTVKKEVRDEFIDCHIKQGFGLFVSMVIFSVLRSFGGNDIRFAEFGLFCSCNFRTYKRQQKESYKIAGLR